MSITIVDKTKPPSPIYVRKPIPTFKSEYEKEKYYAQNKKRCLEGYGDIPGTLYDYLQNQSLKHRLVPRGHESVEAPIARWASLMMHKEFDKTRKQRKVQGVIKARNVGLSTEGGALANYFSKYFPGSNSFITSKDQNGIYNLFMDKIYVPYQHIDKNLRPDELSKNATKQRCFLRLGISHMGLDGGDKYSYSTIECRETSEKPDSPTNFSGQGAAYGYVDEAPLHSRREALFNSFIECFRDYQTKELDGFLLWGGTCEDVMGNEAIAQLKKMIDNKELWDCNILFVPYWWSMFLTNGHPDQKKAEEWWNREFEKVYKDPVKSRAFLRNNPRTEQDIFDSASGGRWESDVEELIKAQKAAILNADVSCPRHHVIYLNGAAEAKIDKKGSIFILEHPKPNCIYIEGIDGVMTDTETGGDEGSDMAGVVIKLYDPTDIPYVPVAIHSERPQTIAGGYEKLINLARYYNKFGGFQKMWAEANAGTSSHFGLYLMNSGLKHWISMRKDLSGKGWADKDKMFQYRTPDHKDFQYRQANIFLRKYAHAIQMMPLIEQMLSPKTDNADILDAWLQFFTCITNFDEKKKEKAQPRPKPQLTLTIENGKTIYKTL